MASEDKKGIKQKKKDISSLFFAGIRQWERGEHILKKERVFRERKSIFSLDFPVFEQSVLVEPRSKVVLRCKG